LAEGYTGAGFETFILIQNPNDTETAVDLTYMLDSGSTLTRHHTVPAHARFTIAAQDPAEVGPDQAFSTRIDASLPVIVERSMYFPSGGHNTIALTQPDTSWFLAEGYTGPGFETFLLIQNPGDTQASLDVTYMLDGGSTLTRHHTVPAHARFTIAAQDPAEVGLDQAFSIRLLSSVPIIVERAMYWPNGGHSTVGIP
jgi:hypothetical protein